MRNILSTSSFLLLTSLAAQAQPRLVAQDFSHYFEWFNDQTSTQSLYTHKSNLYIFGELVNVRTSPTTQSEKVTQLKMGTLVSNIAYAEETPIPEDEINGYADIWYHISGQDHKGINFEGYVWGGLIAKAWCHYDLDGNGTKELILLGVSDKKRVHLSDINASLRVVNQNKLVHQYEVPGLCVFEECASTALVRVLKDPQLEGWPIIETSTITMGCSAGIEKSFHLWNGASIFEVFHAELTTPHIFTNKTFTVISKPKAAEKNIKVKLCEFSHQDHTFNPVWKCKTIKVDSSTPTASINPETVSDCTYNF